MKKETIAMALVALTINAGKANELQLREASEHLAYIAQKKNEARAKYQTALKAYKAIDGAYDSQKAVVRGLQNAIKAKEAAERKAIAAGEIARRYDAYLRDSSHASGGVTDYAY